MKKNESNIIRVTFEFYFYLLKTHYFIAKILILQAVTKICKTIWNNK